MRHLLAGLSTAALAVSAATAQTTTAPAAGTAQRKAADAAAAQADAADEEIVVRGQRPPGSVIGDIPPEQVLTPADIRAYGVNSVSDLLDQLSPQTTSERGRGGEAPVVLLNGKRISSFAEIRDVPTEAILRAEVLPEEVALKYGFSADQKVVNIVLRRRFRSLTGQAEGSVTTDFGGAGALGDGDVFRIRGDGRFQINARYQFSDKLLESQRDLVSTAAGQPYDLTGNVLPGLRGGQIDPLLSVAAGMPVTIAGVPASAASGRPTIASFVPTANKANATDVTDYRTLRPRTNTYTLNTVYARSIFNGISATANGTLTYSDSFGLSGLPAAALAVPAGDPFSPFSQPVLVDRYLSTDALRLRSHTLSAHGGFGMNSDWRGWHWNITGNYDRSDVTTDNDTGLDTSALQAALTAGSATANPFGDLSSILGGRLVNRSRSISNTGDLQLVANRALFELPAGKINTTIKAGGTIQALDATSERLGVFQQANLDRKGANGQINLDVPIANKANGVLPFLGKLTANANVAVNHLSDFGTLRTYGGGINWTPIGAVNLIASYTDDQAAPTIQQLGNPVVLTPQARVFDYIRGQSVDVTAISGGNPALAHDDRRTFRLGTTYKPFAAKDLTVTATYVRSVIRDAIASLPEPTADIEAAFPDRFTRDADGNLTRIDTRPTNFDRETRQSLRLGLTFSVPLKPSQAAIAAFRKMAQERFGFRPGGTGGPPPGEGARPDGPGSPPDAALPGGGRAEGGGGSGGGYGGPGGGRGGPGGGFGGGGFGGGRGGPGGRNQFGGRLQFALYDTVTLQDDILIRPGLGVIDLLNGGSVGSGGGTPRHQLQGQFGYSNNGIGAQLSLNYKTGTSVTGGGGSTAGDLRFMPLATADLRLFLNVGQMPAFIGKDWARNLRVTFAVTNITDSRQRVRDAMDATPIRYQPAYLDPAGRSIRIGIRKLFSPLPPRPVTGRAPGAPR